MAFRRVTRKCGHTMLVGLNGAYVTVAARIRAAESSVCAECAETRRRRHDRFTPMWGEEDHAVRARRIQRQWLDWTTVMARRYPGDIDRINAIRARLESIDDSEWWLDHALDAGWEADARYDG